MDKRTVKGLGAYAPIPYNYFKYFYYYNLTNIGA